MVHNVFCIREGTVSIHCTLIIVPELMFVEVVNTSDHSPDLRVLLLFHALSEK